jgi:outer membrane translocation and assembly module TamA
LQEQLHERTAEVDELRAQLLSKTRALEAARAGQNSGALNRSYVAQAKRSGKEAQTKRKYAVQLEELEKECDEAIIKARKKEQRAIEINADLRNEIHRLRVVSEQDAVQLKDLNAMLSEMKEAIEMERQYSASLLCGEGGGGGGNGKSEIGRAHV